MPPPQTRVSRTTYTTYTYRPRRTTSETAKFQAANIQLAGGWWMTKQSYHNLPSHKRLDTHAGRWAPPEEPALSVVLPLPACWALGC